MLFEQIFNREGYYRTPESKEGEAYLIIKNQTTGEKELHFISFANKNSTKAVGRSEVLTEKVVNSNFRRAISKDELFDTPYSNLEWD